MLSFFSPTSRRAGANLWCPDAWSSGVFPPCFLESLLNFPLVPLEFPLFSFATTAVCVVDGASAQDNIEQLNLKIKHRATGCVGRGPRPTIKSMSSIPRTWNFIAGTANYRRDDVWCEARHPLRVKQRANVVRLEPMQQWSLVLALLYI